MTAASVFITTLLFYIVAVGLMIAYCKTSQKTRGAALLTGVKTSEIHAVDLIGIITLIAWYSLGLFTPQQQQDPVTEVNPSTLGVGILTQLFPCAIVLIILTMRGIDLSSLWNIRWKKPYLIFLIAPIGVTITYLFAFGLNSLGYEAWLTSCFGEHANQQQMISVYQEADAFMVRGMMAVMVVLIAPVTEEFIFRGYIYPATKKFTGPYFATVMTSILFGVVHYNISALLPLIFLAIIFTIAYELTGSIWAPISIHALFNATTIFSLEYLRHSSS